MPIFSLTELANILKVAPPKKETKFTNIAIDSRQVNQSDLFVAIKGAHVDGHDFISTALEKGAAAILTEKHIDITTNFLQVKNSIKALGIWAKKKRQEFNKTPLIAITGSNGKTTVKNMVSNILKKAVDDKEDYFLASRGNLNSDIGLPLNLVNLTDKHKFVVLEMGMSHLGEIAYLTKIAKPNVAIITNAASTHIGEVGSLDNIAKAKSEIFLGLNKNGFAILNMDDKYFSFWRNLTKNKNIITFGFNKNADVRAKNLVLNFLQSSFTLCYKNTEMPITLNLAGRHNVLNALAAAACTLACNIDLATIANALAITQTTKQRLEKKSGIKGATILDDSYNASPISLIAAINSLTSFSGKKILVLGDMKELGNQEITAHKNAGNYAKKAGVDFLITFGDLAKYSADSFKDNAIHFTDKEKLITFLSKMLNTNSCVLIKGSRSMQMEDVVNAISVKSK